jgi:hypothetical protein
MCSRPARDGLRRFSDEGTGQSIIVRCGARGTGYRMRYFRRAWDESRGDEFDAWGPATYWFEAADDGWVRRQLEVYAGGVLLAYDETHHTDRYGGLTDQPLDLVDFAPYEIPSDEFERTWRPATAHNRMAPSSDEA